MKQKILSLLVLLMAAVSGAWAGIPTFQKTIFETTETLSTPIYVAEDTEITIADGAIVTINGGLTIAEGKTLTVNGPGTLVVNGTNGSQGSQGQMMTGNPGGQGTDGSAAITGNIVVKGATVEANGGYGGKGGRGGSGTSGSNPGQGGKGGKGGKGAAAFTGAVTIFSGTITAKGGSGGDGGEGGEGGTNPMDFQNRGSEGDKGEGGANGNAFAGTLTFYGGTVNVVPGSNPGYGKPSGNVSNAFVNPVTMKATTYELRGSNTGNNTAIELAEIVNYRYVSITAADYVESTFDYELTVEASDHGSGTISYTVQDKDDAEKITENAKGANEGDKVTVTITPDEGWIVDATSVKAESYSTWEAAGAPSRRAPGNIQILGDVTLTKSTTAENTWTFQMPAASVLVSAGYIKSSTLYFDPADKTNLVKVTVDGTDRNLNGSKTVKIKRVDNVLEGTAVSLKANDGYKFRKVQVTKTDNGLKLTNPTVGQVIGSDGKNYAYASLPTGVTAVAKICYVSGNSGLALALADESSMMDWATAIETCAAHTPAFKGAEWKLASQDEWNNMKSAAGNYANLRNGFSSVGGTDMRSLQEETYWSSTEQVNSQNAWYMLNSGTWYRHDKSVTKYVRACLAF